MQKNKYHIGQIVTVIAGRKIVEKRVLTINGNGKEITYKLGDPSKALELDFSHFYKLSGQAFGDFASCKSRGFLIEPRGSVGICGGHDNMSYPESQIFENEADFKQRVTIEKYVEVKSKEQLIKEIKEKFNYNTPAMDTWGMDVPGLMAMIEEIAKK